MNVTTVRLISATKRVDNSNDPERTAYIAADVTIGEGLPANFQNGSLTHPDRPAASCTFWRSYGNTHVDFNGYDSFEDQIAAHTQINDFITSVESSDLTDL